MSPARTILVMAGGTGGHIMPGLAVAEVLRARGWNVVWLGNPDKMEGRLVPARGYEMAASSFQGVRGKGAMALLSLPVRLMKACSQVWRHFTRVRPDVVLGMGGYVTFPGGVVARLRGVALIVHEQNAVAGTANRTLARMARVVLSGFPDTLAGARHVGNPVRRDVCMLQAPQDRYAARTGSLRVLVVGGSLGAHALNTVVPEALALLDPSRRPVLIHQSGEKHIDALQERYRAHGVAAQCVAFIDDMAAELGQADVLICRAGAMTVAEVAAAGVAALFVPLPGAIDDHQSANARYLSDAQAAWLQPQASFSAAWLADWLGSLTRQQLSAVAAKARSFALPDAAQRIADICEQSVDGQAGMAS